MQINLRRMDSSICFGWIELNVEEDNVDDDEKYDPDKRDPPSFRTMRL